MVSVFNTGLNEETWIKYSQQIVAKFPELKKAIKDNRLQLPNRNLKKYLYEFPSDYGGLGEVLEEKKFEKVNFFENKVSKNKQIPSIELRNGLLCVPLESSLNIIYNPKTVNISPPVFPPVFPMQIPRPWPPYWDMQYMPTEIPAVKKVKNKDQSSSKSRSRSRNKDKKERKRSRDRSRNRNRDRDRNTDRNKDSDRSRDRSK
jgi:hypothetical protein